MRRSNRRPDEGSAAIEVLLLGVLLLVPLVYLVLTLSTLQSASFAVAGAARQAARAVTLADGPDEAGSRAHAAVAAALIDWSVRDDATTIRVTCAPDPTDCLTPRGTVTVAVTAAVALPLLPLLPPAVSAGQPGSVRVTSTAVQRVSMFAAGSGG